MLARSLNMRLDQQCFDKPTAQQVPCLTQNTDQLVLDDAHSQTMVATLTSGASPICWRRSAPRRLPAAAITVLTSAPSSIVARILSTTHTAQYQYIPALALPKQDRAQSSPEQSAIVPQSQVGAGDRSAASPRLAAAALARGRSPPGFLRGQAFPPPSRRRCASGLRHGAGAQLRSARRHQVRRRRESTCPPSLIPCGADSSSRPRPCSPPTSTAKSPEPCADSGDSTPSTARTTACAPRAPRSGSSPRKTPAL